MPNRRPTGCACHLRSPSGAAWLPTIIATSRQVRSKPGAVAAFGDHPNTATCVSCPDHSHEPPTDSPLSQGATCMQPTAAGGWGDYEGTVGSRAAPNAATPDATGPSGTRASSRSGPPLGGLRRQPMVGWWHRGGGPRAPSCLQSPKDDGVHPPPLLPHRSIRLMSSVCQSSPSPDRLMDARP